MMDFWNEKYMVDILKRIEENDNCDFNELISSDSNYNVSLADCVFKGFIKGIHASKTSVERTFVFQQTDALSLTSLGEFYLEKHS